MSDEMPMSSDEAAKQTQARRVGNTFDPDNYAAAGSIPRLKADVARLKAEVADLQMLLLGAWHGTTWHLEHAEAYLRERGLLEVK